MSRPPEIHRGRFGVLIRPPAMSQTDTAALVKSLVPTTRGSDVLLRPLDARRDAADNLRSMGPAGAPYAEALAGRMDDRNPDWQRKSASVLEWMGKEGALALARKLSHRDCRGYTKLRVQLWVRVPIGRSPRVGGDRANMGRNWQCLVRRGRMTRSGAVLRLGRRRCQRDFLGYVWGWSRQTWPDLAKSGQFGPFPATFAEFGQAVAIPARIGPVSAKFGPARPSCLAQCGPIPTQFGQTHPPKVAPQSREGRRRRRQRLQR